MPPRRLSSSSFGATPAANTPQNSIFATSCRMRGDRTPLMAPNPNLLTKFPLESYGRLVIVGFVSLECCFVAPVDSFLGVVSRHVPTVAGSAPVKEGCQPVNAPRIAGFTNLAATSGRCGRRAELPLCPHGCRAYP